MHFISLLFLCFCVITFVLFWLIKPVYRKYLLILASYIFYSVLGVNITIIAVLVTLVGYLIGNCIYQSSQSIWKKTYLTIGVSLSLLTLCIFKYILPLQNNLFPISNFIFPIGMSFYIFESISYMIDIFRGEAPANSYWDYQFFIMYFPHLLCGPIIRYKKLRIQFENEILQPNNQRILLGLEFIVIGIFCKVFLADPAARIQIPFFNHPELFSVIHGYTALLALTTQIYFDFLGYTYLARGISYWFNIELPSNFNHPYTATTISDFWSRWHMSLTHWIRDYIYRPLGGSRTNQFRNLFNIFLIMLLFGIWHGVRWNFIVWGLYHGILLVLYHLYRKLFFNPNQKKDKNSVSPLYTLYARISMFILIMIGWLIIRNSTLLDLNNAVHKLLNFPAFFNELAHFHAYLIDIVLIILFFMLCTTENLILPYVQNQFQRLPIWGKVVLTICTISGTYWYSLCRPTLPFIYFAF